MKGLKIMRKIYKVLLLMLVMSATFILSACNSSNMSGIKNLTQQQIYTQKKIGIMYFSIVKIAQVVRKLNLMF